jgi:uncharacterized protein
VVPVRETSAKPRVRWGLVGLFYAIALGWALAVAAALYLLGQRDLSGSAVAGWVAAVLAVLYMPVPMVAALIVEKIDRRGFGLRAVFAKGWWKLLARVLVAAVVVLIALLAGMLAASWLSGNVLGISGAGRLLFSHEDLVANVVSNTDGSLDVTQVAAISARLPDLGLLIALTAGGALLAGFTINGLFAFGEEYGWRGWLADELRPLGALRANMITGVLWGLWHAPLVLLGYNYGSYRILGVGFMVVWCVAASFLLWRVRETTGSLLAPAVVHGSINAFAGVFLIVLVDTNQLVAAPMGAVGIAVVAVVAALFWVFTRKPAAAMAAVDVMVVPAPGQPAA